ncbi:hypothetical protein BDR04DRAFT_773536 [Suillus decipiens]|nr:hypothetical protein BDR04DRAFT_773536 [Suillus decipiens]
MKWSRRPEERVQANDRVSLTVKKTGTSQRVQQRSQRETLKHPMTVPCRSGPPGMYNGKRGLGENNSGHKVNLTNL